MTPDPEKRIRKFKYQRPRGMPDLLARDLEYYQKVFSVCQEMAQLYGYSQIEPSLLEEEEVFSKGVGMTSDIVEKQMFLVKSRGGDSLALRPEYTASVVRAYIEQGMEVWSKPVKLWYFGPCFRREKPQAGRFRQFWQFGFENIGERDPVIDSQIIQLFLNALEKLRFKKLIVQINSIGDGKCRSHYKGLLNRYLRSQQLGLCPDCKRRLKSNPLRILDCKEDKCQRIASQGPQILDHLCKECHNHFKGVLEFLDELAVPYRLNPYLVRGLDYYTKTVFEIFSEKSEGKESPAIALAGGGRYDGLVKLLGAKDTPACGAAAGVERIVTLMRQNNFPLKKRPEALVFLAQLGDLAKKKSLLLIEELTDAKIPVAETLTKDSLKAQLARAGRLGVKYALILGQKEALEDKVIIRNMEKGSQSTTPLPKVVAELKKLLS